MAPQEADFGMTEQAMQGNQNRYRGDETLLVKFFKHPRLNSTKSAEAGRPIWEEVDYIQIMQPGNKDSIIQRPATEMDLHRFAEHYQKYVARSKADDDAVEGTLLAEWPGLSRAQCEELRYFNIRTVEQLASVSDSNAQGILGINLLRQRAQNYLKAANNEAGALALEEANAKIAHLQKQVEALLAGKDVDPAAEPKKRGRRRKVVEE